MYYLSGAMMAKRVVSIRLSDETIADLDRLAAADGRTRNNLIQKAIAELLERNQEPPNDTVHRKRERQLPPRK